MILGLDVSTSRIGWAIVNDKQELVDSDFFKTNKKHSLEERAMEVKKQYYRSDNGSPRHHGDKN